MTTPPPPPPTTPTGAPVCTDSDCVVYDMSTASTCTEHTSGPSYDSRWSAGLNSRVHEAILGGHIVAYKIEYSNGWAGWYVPGVNDIDHKFNPSTNTLRHLWSYFYDHSFDYIICV